MSKKRPLLTSDQKKIVRKLINWYYIDSYYKPYFSIAGVAGSGKSFLIKHAMRILGLNPSQLVFVCYTAKAALRLRMLGNNANTIHSVFYQVFKDERGNVRFARKHKLEDNIEMIVIDEARSRWYGGREYDA